MSPAADAATISSLEKTALIATGAAAAWKILLWQLGLSASSAGPLVNDIDVLAVARVAFALLSFASFDLVLIAIVLDARRHGFAWPGAIAAAGAAIISALIALDVAGQHHWPLLHAAPAATLLLFAAHLMLTRRAPAATLDQPAATLDQPAATLASASATVGITIAPAPQLPRTLPEFIAARAAELPDLAPAALADALGTSPDTVRRALAKTQIIDQQHV